MDIYTPVELIFRVGPIYRRRLEKLGIKTVRDLLFHFPHRYEDFSNIVPISEVKFNQTYCIRGKILEIENSRTWKRRMALTQAIVEDATGAIRVVWFNQPYLTKVLKNGDLVYLAGKTSLGKEGLCLSNPAYEKIGNWKLEIRNSEPIHAARLVPVYPETERLSSKWLRFVIRSILEKLKNQIPETLPEKVIKEHNLLPIQKAIWQIHFPDSHNLAKQARERFSFEELFLIELFVLRERFKINKEKAIAIPLNIELVKKFVDNLPFRLTDAQKKSAWQILKNLERPRPMNRLLEGDVGSGKTVVATIAMLNAIKAGCQIVFMAPTEILAKQHFKTVWELLKNFNLNVGLLTGKEDRFYSRKLHNDFIEISRNKLLEKTGKGEINALIGTHALISPARSRGKGQSQNKVKFQNLGLVIVDEQHRFGVEQRARLCRNENDGSKPKTIPHLLSMTATPIPRTLALTIYGDLDLSLIDQLPKGRKKIITKIIAPEDRNKAYDFVRKEVKKGRQVFVICPRIAAPEGGEPRPAFGGAGSWTETKAVKEEYEKLSKKIFPDLKLAMLHGKMTPKEKERIMSAFAKGYGGSKQDFSAKGGSASGGKNKIDILVCTSVIEVGIDVPNATLMIIEGAERFGLSQLHQFRGRVGRSKHQSFCFLFTDSPAKKTRLRLKALVNCENGFELAEKDLEIRGPGDFIGSRQWGIPDLVMNSLTNMSLVEKTKETAKEILISDPSLKNYPLLRERLAQFQQKIHLE